MHAQLQHVRTPMTKGTMRSLTTTDSVCSASNRPVDEHLLRSFRQSHPKSTDDAGDDYAGDNDAGDNDAGDDVMITAAQPNSLVIRTETCACEKLTVHIVAVKRAYTRIYIYIYISLGAWG